MLITWAFSIPKYRLPIADLTTITANAVYAWSLQAQVSFKRQRKLEILLGSAPTLLILCHEEIKSRLKPGNTCYHSVQNILSSSLLSKYRTIILPDVTYWCETWCLTLKEEHWLTVFENTVLRKIFGPNRDEVTGEWRRLHALWCVLLTKYYFGDQIKNERCRACSMG
jgi:hypothetical protein